MRDLLGPWYINVDASDGVEIRNRKGEIVTYFPYHDHKESCDTPGADVDSICSVPEALALLEEKTHGCLSDCDSDWEARAKDLLDRVYNRKF